MRFTRQDLLTFLIGLAAAVIVTLAEALIRLEAEPVSDWQAWGVALLTGILAATGRYLVTRIPEMLARRAAQE